MAKKEKPPWAKLKFVGEYKYKEYEKMTETELVDSLKTQRAYQIEARRNKTQNATLKDIRDDLKEFREKWVAENPKLMAEIEECKNRIKELQDDRDSKIEGDIEEKKDIEGGFGDSIKGSQEHINLLLDFLRKKV